MGFSEFLGNERIVAALRGALRSGRVPHALLFTGPRGVGKFALARMFAQAVNCERLPDDLVYRLAKALNETSERAWAAQDVFYSIRHAAETPTPLHPGAARYYREQRVLK